MTKVMQHSHMILCQVPTCESIHTIEICCYMYIVDFCKATQKTKQNQQQKLTNQSKKQNKTTKQRKVKKQKQQSTTNQQNKAKQNRTEHGGF